MSDLTANISSSSELLVHSHVHYRLDKTEADTDSFAYFRLGRSGLHWRLDPAMLCENDLADGTAINATGTSASFPVQNGLTHAYCRDVVLTQSAVRPVQLDDVTLVLKGQLRFRCTSRVILKVEMVAAHSTAFG